MTAPTRQDFYQQRPAFWDEMRRRWWVSLADHARWEETDELVRQREHHAWGMAEQEADGAEGGPLWEYHRAQRDAAAEEIARRSKWRGQPSAPRPRRFDRAAERGRLEAIRAALPLGPFLEREWGMRFARRRGQWLGRCPLPDHADDTASFRVNNEAGTWWCFGCQRGGDLFALWMVLMDLPFGRAVEDLARRAQHERRAG